MHWPRAGWMLAGPALIAAAKAPAADVSDHSYGYALVAHAMQRFPSISGLAIAVTAKDGTPIAIATGITTRTISFPLQDAMDRPIGTVSFARRTSSTFVPSAVAHYLARRIYSADSLREPDPFVAGARPASGAQALVERMLDDYPDLVTLAMHVAPPGRPNAIIASSFGRIGKPADADDRRVMDTGAVLRETTDGGARLAVELPLLDRCSRRIGALSTSLRVLPRSDPEAAYRRATTVRDALARTIPSLDALTGATSPQLSRRKRCSKMQDA